MCHSNRGWWKHLALCARFECFRSQTHTATSVKNRLWADESDNRAKHSFIYKYIIQTIRFSTRFGFVYFSIKANRTRDAHDQSIWMKYTKNVCKRSRKCACSANEREFILLACSRFVLPSVYVPRTYSHNLAKSEKKHTHTHTLTGTWTNAHTLRKKKVSIEKRAVNLLCYWNYEEKIRP